MSSHLINVIVRGMVKCLLTLKHSYTNSLAYPSVHFWTHLIIFAIVMHMIWIVLEVKEK